MFKKCCLPLFFDTTVKITIITILLVLWNIPVCHSTVDVYTESTLKKKKERKKNIYISST